MADATYTAQATSSGGGRDGRIRTSDGFVDQDLRVPPELGGSGEGTNPEQLFAAAYAACFHGALRLVAKNEGLTVPDGATVDASVSLAPDETSFGISAVITAHLSGLDQADADKLVAAAHQVCPYSKATRGNVDVKLEATV